MKALITGGAGFIGSNVAKYFLEEGYEVVLLDNLSTGCRENIPQSPKARFIEGDILDSAILQKAARDCKVVLHLAASVGNQRAIENPSQDSQVNVVGTLNVLEAARKEGIKKVVYSSSAGIFGELKTLPINEDHPKDPDTPYGVSKLAGELQGLCYGKLYGIDFVALRYFNVYGPGQRYDAYGNVIPIFATRRLKKEPFTIYGDGEQTRDFVHVGDVAQANFLAATKPAVGGVYNIGSATTITINKLASLMNEVSGPPHSPVKYAPVRKGDVRHSLADITKAKTRLGFQPRFSLEKDLKNYWEWVVSV